MLLQLTVGSAAGSHRAGRGPASGEDSSPAAGAVEGDEVHDGTPPGDAALRIEKLAHPVGRLRAGRTIATMTNSGAGCARADLIDGCGGGAAFCR
ncbi:MAG: hypothetical protein M0Z28_04730 [Rhodospirillales bacterium]|nr:hypothetical protein [Rhodospirillales bacterium]